MLYIIGGAARAGKSMVARRMLMEAHVPYFCIDYFVTALDRGAPELEVLVGLANEIRAKKLWPRIEPMLRNIVEAEAEYTIEGDAILPESVNSLVGSYGSQIRTCFLGYTSTSPEKKLREIREFKGGINDWIQVESDEYILDMCRQMISFSRHIQDECNTYGIPYIDVSTDFMAGLGRAYSILTS